MTAIQWDAWGRDINQSDPITGSVHVVPAFPACCEWEATSDQEYHKYKTRVFYHSPNDWGDELRVTMVSGSRRLYGESMSAIASKDLEKTVAACWDATWENALVSEEYPSGSHGVSSIGNKNVLMPYHYLGAGFVDAEDYGPEYVCTIYGIEHGVSHTEAYGGNDMELFDYSAGSAYETDAPASSVVVSLMLIEAYNRILYDATWRITFAVGPPARA